MKKMWWKAKKMKILGKVTMRIYSLDEKSQMSECGIQIADKQALDTKFIKAHHIYDMLDCFICRGCRQAQIEYGFGDLPTEMPWHTKE